jgi:DNA-binding protein HU-beta
MTTLSKSELISHISKTTNVSSTDVDSVVSTLLDTITATLKSGGEVKFLGFGSFSVQSSAAREGRNPRTGETLQIKASKRPVFKAGKTLKDAVNV